MAFAPRCPRAGLVLSRNARCQRDWIQRSATKALRQEVDLIAAAKDKALEELRRLRDKVGGRNKPAKLIGVSRPYLGRVLRGEKPMTEELVQKVVQLRRDKIAMPTDLRWRP